MSVRNLSEGITKSVPPPRRLYPRFWLGIGAILYFYGLKYQDRIFYMDALQRASTVQATFFSSPSLLSSLELSDTKVYEP